MLTRVVPIINPLGLHARACARIVNIADMAPQTDTSHCAAQPARFALEVHRGWFAEHGVDVGMRIDFAAGAAIQSTPRVPSPGDAARPSAFRRHFDGVRSGGLSSSSM